MSTEQQAHPVTVGTTMTLTLSIDHRAVDGATAAAFLTRLRELIEERLGILLWKPSASGLSRVF
jgi:pyruvate/2-oxoglutarate dehydrogenase complex dihydrolipoamide acyltransferase (E2) component